MSIPHCLDALLLVMVVTAAANDLRTRRIPNLLLLSGALGALALHGLSPSPAVAMMAAFAGASVGLLIFMPLYCLRGMAAGDIKLMAAVGFFNTPAEMMQLALLTVCAGGVMALAVVIFNGRLHATIANVLSLLRPLWMRLVGVHLAPEPMPGPSVGSIPYGLAIACGTLLILAQRHG
ncbi:MAG: prepilin peptidase [Massilia sp.]|nr:prepilin peptidase [Massilia sp.]